MKTTFEKELRKLFDNDAMFDDAKFVGRRCYGRLDGDIRVRAEFISTHISSQYDALKINLINRKEGIVDSVLLRLDDVFGVKSVSNPNYREGISPHLWQNGSDLVWYVYQPTPADFELLSERIDDYLEVFRDPEQTAELYQSM